MPEQAMKILLIDDEKNLIEMVKVRLECHQGYAVTTAYSGKEGLEKIKITEYNRVWIKKRSSKNLIFSSNLV